MTPKFKVTQLAVRQDGKGAAAMTPGQRTQFLNAALDELAVKHKLDRRKNYDRLFQLAQAERPDLFLDMKESEYNVKAKKN